MRSLLKSVVAGVCLFLVFVVGFEYGQKLTPPPTDCKLEESRAIKGCETVAIDINHQLRATEHQLVKCDEAFDTCQAMLRELYRECNN